MEAWIVKWRAIRPDFEIGLRASQKLTSADLIAICGDKPIYSLDDAQRLYKKQWTVEEYRSAMDREKGYSPERMLSILQQRAQYLMSSGATLNNPHVPKRFLSRFQDQLILREHAARIREKFAKYYTVAR